MAEYHVAYMVCYSDTIDAESPEEAAEIVAQDCPYDIDGAAAVSRIDTGEFWEI